MTDLEAEENANSSGRSSPVDDMTNSNPLASMQTELHIKGAVLTKAWSDLFSFITKYQAELVVKENTVEIAEKEIVQRRRQLEEVRPMVDAGNDEVFQLREEIMSKERLLNKFQSELNVKEQMLQRIQTDLSANAEILERTRQDQLEGQSQLVRCRGDLERLKSELTIKQEQIQLKDSLLRKLQNQLMKENAELKEQLELERRALELEQQSHQITKRSVASQGDSRKRPRTASNVIEIPDSPPTIQLSVDDDFNISNIISTVESQTHTMSGRQMSVGLDNTSFSQSFSSDSVSFTSSPVTHLLPGSVRRSSQPSTPQRLLTDQNFDAGVSVKNQISSSLIDNLNEAVTTASELFYPLSPPVDRKPSIDSIASSPSASLDGQPQGQMTLNQNAPFSVASSSSHDPVPISGPIPNPSALIGSPGGSTDGRGDPPKNNNIGGGAKFSGRVSAVNQEGLTGNQPAKLSFHGKRHKVHVCTICKKLFSSKSDLTVHIRFHTGERPFKCSTCGKAFAQKGDRKRHEIVHIGKPFACQLCGLSFLTAEFRQVHINSVHSQ